MRLSLIVAMAENRMIGIGGKMPWHISADLRYFRQITMGAPVIMGRKTHDSIGRALPGRPNIIITRRPDFAPGGVHVAHDLQTAAQLAGELASGDEVFVIGGAQIYELALPVAGRIYLTEIHASPDGDTRFPEIDRAQWVEVSRRTHPAESNDGPTFSFVILERI